MSKNTLSNNPSNYVEGDGEKVIVKSIADAPGNPDVGGISPSDGETGFWIQSNADFEIKFKYADNSVSPVVYVQEDNQHDITISKSNAEAGVQVPWLEHQIYGKPALVYFVSSKLNQHITIIKLTSAINHDSDFKDGEHDSNFLSFSSNSIKMGTVGKAYATQTTTNEFGYRAIRHDNNILIPGENIEVVVDGIVDYIAILRNDVINVDATLEKDLENEQTAIVFTVPSDYDNEDSSNTIVTWYSVGKNVENLEFEIYVGDGSNDGSPHGLSSDFYFRSVGHDDHFFGRAHGGETHNAAVQARDEADPANRFNGDWELFKIDFTIDWGDGTVEAYDGLEMHPDGTGYWQPMSGKIYSHTYASSGYYKISIGGNPQGLEFGSSPSTYGGIPDPMASTNQDVLNASKVRNLTQWGTHRWKRTPSFQGCVFMDINATDQPLYFGADSYSDPDGNIVFNNEGKWESNIETGSFFENDGEISFEDCLLLRNENNSIAGWDLADIFNKYRAIEVSQGVYQRSVTLNRTFKNCKKYIPINFNNWTSYWSDNNIKVTGMISTFEGCELFNGDISSWPVEIFANNNIIQFNKVFKGCELFNGDVSAWDVSDVASFFSTFEDCKSFNQDLSQWNVSNATSFQSTFKGCESFNQNLSNWTNNNTLNVKEMFSGCSVFNNAGSDLPTWTVSNLEGTFKGCEVFLPSNNIQWTTTSVTSLEETFMDCKIFNLYKVKDWNTSNVTEFRSCFEGCDNTAVNGTTYPSNWDITNATSLNRMFFKTNINVNFNGWDFSNIGLNFVNALSTLYSNMSGTVEVYTDGTEDVTNMTNFSPFPYTNYWADGGNLEIDGWMKNFLATDHTALYYQLYDILLAKLATELPDLGLADAQANFEVAETNSTGYLGGPYYGRIDMGQTQRSSSSSTNYDTIREKGWLIIDGGEI